MDTLDRPAPAESDRLFDRYSGASDYWMLPLVDSSLNEPLCDRKADEVARNLVALLGNPGLAGRLSDAAPEMVRKRFSWPVLARHFKKLADLPGDW